MSGPPIKQLIVDATPSPRSVRAYPGSFEKSFPIIFDNTEYAPICSLMVTNAIGIIANDQPVN